MADDWSACQPLQNHCSQGNDRSNVTSNGLTGARKCYIPFVHLVHPAVATCRNQWRSPAGFATICTFCPLHAARRRANENIRVESIANAKVLIHPVLNFPFVLFRHGWFEYCQPWNGFSSPGQLTAAFLPLCVRSHPRSFLPSTGNNPRRINLPNDRVSVSAGDAVVCKSVPFVDAVEPQSGGPLSLSPSEKV